MRQEIAKVAEKRGEPRNQDERPTIRARDARESHGAMRRKIAKVSGRAGGSRDRDVRATDDASEGSGASRCAGGSWEFWKNGNRTFATGESSRRGEKSREPLGKAAKDASKIGRGGSVGRGARKATFERPCGKRRNILRRCRLSSPSIVEAARHRKLDRISPGPLPPRRGRRKESAPGSTRTRFEEERRLAAGAVLR
ncbi:hypothetical protein KM043_008986 [Ampulex compressa]|nr:hypothetical protein KM043_008986 [Ampulex compressa]